MSRVVEVAISGVVKLLAASQGCRTNVGCLQAFGFLCLFMLCLPEFNLVKKLCTFNSFLWLQSRIKVLVVGNSVLESLITCIKLTLLQSYMNKVTEL